MSYDDTNRGSIWKNENKRPDKQDADYTGTLNVDGVEYWVNAWRRKRDASPRAPELTFTVRPKEERRPAPPRQPTSSRRDPISTGRHYPDLDDDIPL